LYILPPGSTKAEKINPNWYTKLENDYAVNLNQFYENIINCDNSDPDVQALVVGGPSCMFGINVIKTSSKGCWPACFPDNANTLPDTFKDSSTRGQGIFETCHSEICPNERLPLACSWASVKDFDQDNCHI
jgi:hypothetical protein